ncbi:hypothetical protein ONE63_009484 [Megalurothrips usitatus]|uniref:Nuclear receptor-binding factor 2 MIT domain-containing protein n=1 Tax=Megalurothrips usitatus TaxID=439358 RepID=A0AAV7XS93_9NEOP|nr:hypothetical protein ONE63_009484 [Megalurothrips usitatus]
MEDSPLNRAHREDRRAQQHLKSGRFEEAVRCHQLAAKFIDDAITVTSTPRALESLNLQKEFHLRQLQIVELKKAQLRVLKEAIETKRKMIAHMREKNRDGEQKGQEPKNLQTAIYKTMQEADSLLIELLGGATSDEPTAKVTNQDTSDQDSTPTLNPLGSKHPKEDRVVIEELHTLNNQLRDLINALMIQLDESERENKALRVRIVELESELVRSNQAHDSAGEPVGLQVITDSTGGNFSPFVLSPVSQLSPDGAEPRELPPLAPLEMPKFDYNL